MDHLLFYDPCMHGIHFKNYLRTCPVQHRAYMDIESINVDVQDKDQLQSSTSKRISEQLPCFVTVLILNNMDKLEYLQSFGGSDCIKDSLIFLNTVYDRDFSRNLRVNNTWLQNCEK